MKFILLLLHLCIISAALSAQQPGGRTIYQELKITPGGCKISSIHPYESEMESVVFYREPSAESDVSYSNVSSSPLNVIDQSRPLFKLTSRFADRYTAVTPPVIIMSNGNVLFKENDLYGLKTSVGKIIINPSFQYIIPDGKKGFVAYKDGVCNYYNLNGKKFLDKDCYFIQPTAINTYIIQTDAGFGVMDTMKKVIIKPSFYKITTLADKGQFYYKVFKTKNAPFYLSRNTKDTIWVNGAGMEPEILSADYWMAFGSLINIKTKRSVICEPKYYLEVLSSEDQLLSVTDDGKKYLINFKGQLLNKEKFKEINSYHKGNFWLASIESPSDENAYMRSSLWGALNNKGNWVIKPIYARLNSINDHLLEAGLANGFKAIISMEGKALTPFKYTDIRTVGDSMLLGVVASKDTVMSDLIRIRDIKIMRTNLPYRSINEAEVCNRTTYIAELKRGECWLNEEFEPILKRSYSRIFYGPDKQSIIASDFFSGKSGSESQLYDCNGVVKQFNIAGKKYETFNAYTFLHQNFDHVLLTDGTGYFVLPDGSAVSNNSHWQDIKKANNKDLFVTMIYGGKFGIVNSEGVTIIPPVFEYISPYDLETGLASYNYNDKQKGYLTTEGELLFGTTYEDCEWLGFGLFKVKQHNNWGVVNREHKVIVPVEYEDVQLNGGIILAGNESAPMKYTQMGERVD